MLVRIKFTFNKQSKNLKNASKAINLKTLKLKTILFNKHINKTMLAIINSQKINEECIKILKYLHKILVFERVIDKKHTIQQSETIYGHVFIFTQKVWIDMDAG